MREGQAIGAQEELVGMQRPERLDGVGTHHDLVFRHIDTAQHDHIHALVPAKRLHDGQ